MARDRCGRLTCFLDGGGNQTQGVFARPFGRAEDASDFIALTVDQNGGGQAEGLERVEDFGRPVDVELKRRRLGFDQKLG